ncbi:MAG TPA: adenosine kinase [Rhodospirillaceae bacterium]|jgi:sugar/nucleoside kinase (ribokinase family)|nr:adenosine kinase [Alphaproteobacteria bacterium]HBH27025.1 adenosine kinase [Rhodospirillaceae bacterium]
MEDMELVGLGSALVDVLAHVTDEFMEDQTQTAGLVKGTMALVDEARATALYDLLPPAIESSGGSVANTVAGFAALGGRAAFVGKIAADQLGQVFTHDMRALGVTFDVAPLTHGAATGRSLILITPDAQRTMNTFLGAAQALTPADAPQDLIERAEITYIEGYLFDMDGPRAAAVEAARIAKDAGRRVALSLCDPFCVERHRAAFTGLIEGGSVDIVLANEAEAVALTGAKDARAALDALACPTAAVTRSERGALVKDEGRVVEVPAVPGVEVLDTTGAGDAFAAGFLFGLARRKPLEGAGHLGCRAAARIIAHVGARPEGPLTDITGR